MHAVELKGMVKDCQDGACEFQAPGNVGQTGFFVGGASAISGS